LAIFLMSRRWASVNTGGRPPPRHHRPRPAANDPFPAIALVIADLMYSRPASHTPQFSQPATRSPPAPPALHPSTGTSPPVRASLPKITIDSRAES
jgi:hypothetical protein